MGHTYMIEALHKKSTYETEEWHNILENGKQVILYITTFYRWGSFTANLSKNEVKEIIELDEIIISNYDNYEMVDLIDGDSLSIKIKDEDSFNSTELDEINKLIYFYEGEYSEFDICEFEKNGWDLYECEYGIVGGCYIEDTS